MLTGPWRLLIYPEAINKYAVEAAAVAAAVIIAVRQWTRN